MELQDRDHLGVGFGSGSDFETRKHRERGEDTTMRSIRHNNVYIPGNAICVDEDGPLRSTSQSWLP